MNKFLFQGLSVSPFHEHSVSFFQTRDPHIVAEVVKEKYNGQDQQDHDQYAGVDTKIFEEAFHWHLSLFN